MLKRAATVVQQLCKSYCRFYFTCDRSFIAVVIGLLQVASCNLQQLQLVGLSFNFYRMVVNCDRSLWSVQVTQSDHGVVYRKT